MPGVNTGINASFTFSYLDIEFDGQAENGRKLFQKTGNAEWQEVNITTELPGWRRYPPAEQWLRRNMEVARPPSPDDLKTMFAQYIDERRRATGGAPMTEREKEDLFQQYHRWESDQSR